MQAQRDGSSDFYMQVQHVDTLEEGIAREAIPEQRQSGESDPTELIESRLEAKLAPDTGKPVELRHESSRTWRVADPSRPRVFWPPQAAL